MFEEQAGNGTIWGLIPALLGALLKVRELLAEQSSHAAKKRELELLKTAVQIDILRKKHDLPLKPIVTEDDIARFRQLDLPWHSPERIRRHYWYYLANKRPRLLLAAIVGTVFFSLWCLVGTIYLLTVLLGKIADDGLLKFSGEDWILLSILVFDVWIGVYIVKNCVIAYRARQLSKRTLPEHQASAAKTGS